MRGYRCGIVGACRSLGSWYLEKVRSVEQRGLIHGTYTLEVGRSYGRVPMPKTAATHLLAYRQSPWKHTK